MDKLLIKNSTLKDRQTNFDHMLELYKSAKEDIFSSRYQIEKEKRIRREIANSNERRRMQSINAGFNTLRNLIPTRHKEKMSKASILQQTADYIRFLEEEKTILMKRNAQLEAFLKINNLQAACNNLILNSNTSPSPSPQLQQPILSYPHNPIKAATLSSNDLNKSNQESAFKTILTAIDTSQISKIPLITNSIKMSPHLITSSHILPDTSDSAIKNKIQTLSTESLLIASRKRKQSATENTLDIIKLNDITKPILLDNLNKPEIHKVGKKTKVDTLSVDEGIYLSSPDHNNNLCSSGENFAYDDSGSNTILRKKFKMLGPMFRNFAPEPLPLTLSTSSIQTHSFLQPQKGQLLKIPSLTTTTPTMNKMVQISNMSQPLIINNLNASTPTSTLSTSSITTIPLSLTPQNITFLKNFPTFINTIDGKQTIYLRKNEDMSKSQIIISNKIKDDDENMVGTSPNLHDDSLIEKLENITKNLPPHDQDSEQPVTGENYTTTSRRNLQTIVEAIKHLEGENLFVDELTSPPAIKKETTVDISSFFEDKPLEDLKEVLNGSLMDKDQNTTNNDNLIS